MTFNYKHDNSTDHVGEILSVQIGSQPVHEFGNHLWQRHKDTLSALSTKSKNVSNNDDNCCYCTGGISTQTEQQQIYDAKERHHNHDEQIESCRLNLNSFFRKKIKAVNTTDDLDIIVHDWYNRPLRLVALCDRTLTGTNVVNFSECSISENAQLPTCSSKYSRAIKNRTCAFNFDICSKQCFTAMPVWDQQSSIYYTEDHCELAIDRIRLQIEDCDNLSQVKFYCYSPLKSIEYWNEMYRCLLPSIYDELTLKDKMHISLVGPGIEKNAIRHGEILHYLLLMHHSLIGINASTINNDDFENASNEHLLCSAHTQPMDYFTKNIGCPGLMQITRSLTLAADKSAIRFTIDETCVQHHMRQLCMTTDINNNEQLHVYIDSKTGSEILQLTAPDLLKNMPLCWRNTLRHMNADEINVAAELYDLHETIDWYREHLSLNDVV
ncbi:hypothetical protein GJ496_009457 [Pomphorhynchus laevis]|nr:hypothetical protein GJ496_009457 [Pomphorhynchus laevis]